MNEIRKAIMGLFHIPDKVRQSEFDKVSNEVYQHQLQSNSVFKDYVSSLGHWSGKFPVFLPISAFKSRIVMTGNWHTDKVFFSSSTTGINHSKHYLKSADWYNYIAKSIFESRYGPLHQWRILAILPSYHEQQQSSLLHMIDHFIQSSGHPESGYYHGKLPQLIDILQRKNTAIKTLLWGVSYALLDLADAWSGPGLDSRVVVLETGGMKGRREEMPKEELHKILQVGLGVSTIHSEYGMTELLSQAYMTGGDRFLPPPTMRVMVREINDPKNISQRGRGGLNIVDLANVDTCSFIETDDLGEVFLDGSFRVYGRLDNTQLRGCNLLYTEV